MRQMAGLNSLENDPKRTCNKKQENHHILTKLLCYLDILLKDEYQAMETD